MGERSRTVLGRAGGYFARWYGAREGLGRVSESGAMAAAMVGVFAVLLLFVYLR